MCSCTVTKHRGLAKQKTCGGIYLCSRSDKREPYFKRKQNERCRDEEPGVLKSNLEMVHFSTRHTVYYKVALI